jgi:hypothetical protein
MVSPERAASLLKSIRAKTVRPRARAKDSSRDNASATLWDVGMM